MLSVVKRVRFTQNDDVVLRAAVLDADWARYGSGVWPKRNKEVAIPCCNNEVAMFNNSRCNRMTYKRVLTVDMS